MYSEESHLRVCAADDDRQQRLLEVVDQLLDDQHYRQLLKTDVQQAWSEHQTQQGRRIKAEAVFDPNASFRFRKTLRINRPTCLQGKYDRILISRQI